MREVAILSDFRRHRVNRIWLRRVGGGIALTIGISIVFSVLGFLGLAFGGAGHGSIFFGKMIAAPFSISQEEGIRVFDFGFFLFPFDLAFSLWPVVAALLAFRRIGACRIAAAALLGVHYLGILLLCSRTTDWGYIRKIGEMILPYLAIYVGLQVFMWTLILRAMDFRHMKISRRPVT